MKHFDERTKIGDEHVKIGDECFSFFDGKILSFDQYFNTEDE